MDTRSFTRYADLPALIGLMTGDEKHQAAAVSTLDVLWVLYDRVLDITPGRVDDPDRDRFLLSKGHGPAAYYAVLAAKGFVEVPALRRWGEFDSPLGHHPDRTLIPGVEIGSGSLGHGLGLAVGTALGLRALGRTRPRVVVLVGDAELDEGSNHEAIAAAGRLGTDRLTAVVVDNQSASLGWPGGIAERFAREGWATRTVDGRDHEALFEAFTAAHTGRPMAVVARVPAKNSAAGVRPRWSPAVNGGRTEEPGGRVQ
ncbi:thiamine pyrophosphate-dependent enzyme [Marinactinospora rubrisoli]|uniref:Thiamine pyrophosphate-dependent enzyme n=1 Tax=Marinactinospora rubrisoli TaxID=2715399 RepID=A0ABW2K9J6_9ACTN